jgi:hypothetical protein
VAVSSLSNSSIRNFNRYNVLSGPVPSYPDFSGGLEDSFTIDDISYTSHIFTSSTTATVGRSGYVDLMVVAGGGGGAEGEGTNSYSGGGGGAGGLFLYEGIFLEAGTYTVTVGAGGAQADWSSHGNPGSPSAFYLSLAGFVALGGGGAGRYSGIGQFGGSGGGGGGNYKDGGLGVITQGHAGGSGSGGAGGGGGGAGAVGIDVGGGGVGSIVTLIPVSVATSRSVGEVSGTDVYFAGGGGGGQNNGTYPGGLGGGGAGESSTTRGNAGTANTGGGGGGGENGGGGAGGSGVIIVRYKTA